LQSAVSQERKPLEKRLEISQTIKVAICLLVGIHNAETYPDLKQPATYQSKPCHLIPEAPKC
jgi:hypothetical protein